MRLKMLGAASIAAMMMIGGAAHATVQQNASGPLGTETPKAAPAPAGDKLAVVETKADEANTVSEVAVPSAKALKKQKAMELREARKHQDVIRDPFEALQNPAVSFTRAGTFATGRAGP